MRIAKEGYPIIFSAVVAAAVTLALGWVSIACIALLLTLSVAAFFRDPERIPPTGEGLIVSPADGKVVSIAALNGESPFYGAATRISIFLSPFDVHINRTPVKGKVEGIKYQRGKFLAAYRDDASERNEQNALQVRGW